MNKAGYQPTPVVEPRDIEAWHEGETHSCCYESDEFESGGQTTDLTSQRSESTGCTSG